MAGELKIGIIGCGQVSRVGHGPAIISDERACITAIADPDDENRAKFGRMFRVPAAYPEHREMLKKEELDAVIIASPPWLHRDQLRDAIEAGVHILCEKPIATTLEDCEAMVEMAAGHPRVIQAGHSKRFETGFQRIKEMIDSGMMGDIYQMSIYWHYDIPDFESGRLKTLLEFSKKHWIDFEKRYGTWRYFDPRAGGGDFFDHAPHYIDLMRFLFGEIESLYCQTRRFIKSRLHEDLAVAIFTLANEAVAVMEKSTLVIGRPAGFETGCIHDDRLDPGRVSFGQGRKGDRKKRDLWRDRLGVSDRSRGLSPAPRIDWTKGLSHRGWRDDIISRVRSTSRSGSGSGPVNSHHTKGAEWPPSFPCCSPGPRPSLTTTGASWSSPPGGSISVPIASCS